MFGFGASLRGQAAEEGHELPVVLNVVAQDRQLFASWNRISGATYTLRWRRQGALDWAESRQVDEPYAAIDSLRNGARYDVQLVIGLGYQDFPSAVITRSPRARDDCGYGSSVFCTEESFLKALPRYGLDRNSLRCRGQLIPEGKLLPNCLYTGSGVALGLNRSYGARFSTESNGLSPDVVRAVVQKAIWGTNDFEAVKRQYAWNGIPMSLPYLGRVDPEAEVQSYLVPITSTMYSRLSWFVRPDHIPGRYAIYHEGHGETGLASGAPVINWLLDNGWEVISLDMPLEGINEEDRQFPLYDHDSFITLDNSDSTRLAWFFIPLVAAMNLVVKDYRGDGHPTVMMLGRSGGGWTTYTYAAMDPRVDLVVNISGGAPLSTFLDSTVFGHITPHYESQPDYLYDQVSLTDIMLAAGTVGTFFFYSELDPCCYRFSPRSSWIRYLQDLSLLSTNKQYEVFVDRAPMHGLSPNGLAMLGKFLRKQGLGPLPARSNQSSPPD